MEPTLKEKVTSEIKTLCQVLCEDIENLKEKAWILPALKSHVFTLLIKADRKDGRRLLLSRDFSDKVVDIWFNEV